MLTYHALTAAILRFHIAPSDSTKAKARAVLSEYAKFYGVHLKEQPKTPGQLLPALLVLIDNEKEMQSKLQNIYNSIK